MDQLKNEPSSVPAQAAAATTITTTTATSKYVRDFESLFVPIRPDNLRYRARCGNLRDCQFRSLCWRYFLHCLPEQFDQWPVSCVQSRQLYEKIKAKNSPKKHSECEQAGAEAKTVQSTVTPIIDNTCDDSSKSGDNEIRDSGANAPATDSENSTIESNRDKKLKELEEERQYMKAANECDHKNVYKTIERDVIRTFPDMEFFRQTEMQEILSNVLFNFASETPHLSYKQGMHELLAALLYVLHTDYQNCLINHEGGYANDTIATLLDIKYLEHDAFHLFCALMKSIQTWYQNDDMVPESVGSNGIINRSGRQQVGSVLGIKLKRISENIVRNYDLELFNHLEALQIAPQIYGIRWMRLLFGREFEFLDLLTVWDAIICDIVPMSLTDYIFASMLVTIREELVNGDYTECLNNLMRHQFKDVQYVIRLALHLRDPENNKRPRTIQKSGIQRQPVGDKSNRYGLDTTSLANKLSQQYISGSNKLKQQAANYMSNPHSKIQNSYAGRYMSNVDNRSDNIRGSNSKYNPQDKRFEYQSNSIAEVASSGIRFLSQSGRSSGPFSGSKNKFLPNINKLVSSIGQNIQDKTNQVQFTPSSSSSYRRPIAGSSSSHNIASDKHAPNRQYPQRSGDQLLLTTSPIVKEFEMREMLTSSDSSSRKNQLTIGALSGSKSALNLSTESYDDLHSIVDYCWRLLSEQIDSLQRCLPKEKGLSSEDEIFVALAQLKKVRDVLKGSLRLEDELESPVGGSKT